MSDIFSEGVEFEPAQSAEPQTDPAPAAPAFEDNSGLPEVVESQEPSASDATAPQGDQDAQGTAQQPPEPTQEDLDKLEQEAEAAISDPRAPKWYQNAVKSVYKPKIGTLEKQVEQYSAFGSPEELTEKVGLLNKLGEIQIDPSTRMPVKSTRGFVEAIYEKDAEIAHQLMADLATLPAPDGSGQTMIQALFNNMGIDPARIPDIQQFAANGYQLQTTGVEPPDPSDLALIPQHLQATFAKLEPEVRDSLMSDIDSVRDRNLEAHRYRMEAEERRQAEESARVQNEQTAQQRQQQEFVQAVDTKAEEYFEKGGEAVLTSFVDSLTKQSGLNPMDALMATNTLLNSFEPTLAGRRTAEALKAVGIEIDPAIPQAVNQLRDLARSAAYFEVTGDKESLGKIATATAEVQERILAKGNKVIGPLSKLLNGRAMASVKEQNTALNATITDRYAFSGAPRTGNENGQNGRTAPMDFSEEAYMEDLRASGLR